MIAKTPSTPYYAVIFSSEKKEDLTDYIETANRMVKLASQQPGFLGVESAGEEFAITVSYWESLEAIKNWKAQSEHLMAQQRGIKQWYKAYKTRICLVERAYGFDI